MRNTAFEEIIDNFQKNKIFFSKKFLTIGKPLTNLRYPKPTPNDYACWYGKSETLQKNLAGFSVWPFNFQFAKLFGRDVDFCDDGYVNHYRKLGTQSARGNEGYRNFMGIFLLFSLFVLL